MNAVASKAEKTIEAIRARLNTLLPAVLTIADDSHLHRHHAEGGSGLHLRLRIVSARFEGLTIVRRHRLIYQTVGDLSTLGVHALAIRAHTPSEATAAEQPPAAANG